MQKSNTTRPSRRYGRLAVCAAGGALALLATLVAAHAQSGQGSRQRPGLRDGTQPALAPTKPTVACPNEGAPLLKLPEIVSEKGILRGTLALIDEQQRISSSAKGTPGPCAPQYVRNFRSAAAPIPASDTTVVPTTYADPVPGPTLRAQLGDIVQLTFLNEVNSNHFDPNIDREACIQVSPGGGFGGYPGQDEYPNCLHASSTANLHFHGTHVSPTSTADNIFLQVRPLPRNNAGDLVISPDQITTGLNTFFENCTKELANPKNQWPHTWSQLPSQWSSQQETLLKAYDAGTTPYNPPGQPEGQKLWPPNAMLIEEGGWPQYYVGAFPYCFALPEYKEATWSWPPKAGVLNMGQSPGTHWYHAHKHGATAINVANGMIGAFIIEGKSYDGALNEAYKGYTVNGKPWNTRDQPVIVLNQISVAPNLLGGLANVDFTVNGRLRPTVNMNPGEIQLWRIVNGSGRSAAYFMPPQGLEWYQLAQDGVQFANVNYQNSHNKPFYMASGNRVDLLVRAPSLPTGQPSLSTDVKIQNVISRKAVKTTGGTVTLFTVNVTGQPVGANGQPMPFLPSAPPQPPFLTDITDSELSGGPIPPLVFNSAPSTSGNPGTVHTINDKQFNGEVNIRVPLNHAQEWVIKNATTNANGGPGAIDHPFHIHVNPFQITEFFDPNERVPGPDGVPSDKPRYVVAPATADNDQCQLDPSKPSTWVPCKAKPFANGIWWDTFAIPSGLAVTAGTTTTIIPGYFKMRSRFVDYAGVYVLHCHILVHEDRGMMFEVEVVANNTLAPHMSHH